MPTSLSYWPGKSLATTLSSRRVVLDHIYLNALEAKMALGIVTHEDNFDHGNNAATILMIPGFSFHSVVMSILWERLKEKYNVAYADITKLSWLDRKGMLGLSDNLEAQIEKLLQEREHNGDIHLVGHSLGWVLWVLCPLISTKIWVNQIIQLAAPNSGAPVGKALGPIACLQDLNNPYFLEQKGRGISQGGKNIGGVTSHIALDDHLVPPESQNLEGLPIIGSTSKREWAWFDHLWFFATENIPKVVEAIIWDIWK